jgi:hypothetical protein
LRSSPGTGRKTVGRCCSGVQFRPAQVMRIGNWVAGHNTKKDGRSQRQWRCWLLKSKGRCWRPRLLMHNTPRDERLAARWGAERKSWLEMTGRCAWRRGSVQRSKIKILSTKSGKKSGRCRPPTLSNTCVVPKWRSFVLTIDNAGSCSVRRAGLPQRFVSRGSARKELRKPTTGWGRSAARRSGLPLELARLHNHKNSSRMGPKREMGGWR